jgi:steroid 5-alpha reductase family enzyme
MDIINLVCLAVGLLIAMGLAWGIQRTTGASGWIDTIWSFAVGLGGVCATLIADGSFERRMMILVLVAIWSLRLGGHIGARTRGADEDPRYAKLIEEWGERASSRLFLFLQIQALAAFVLVLDVYAAATNPTPYGPLDAICLLVAIVALAGEATADLQLARFRKTPQAKTDVCETGLWAYSRHPNYFFEWLFWCAWPLAALPSIGWAALSLLAPVMMYWLLVHVSGIPPLEEHMLKSRGEKFRALQNRVNAFFPGPRKSSPTIQGAST